MQSANVSRQCDVQNLTAFYTGINVGLFQFQGTGEKTATESHSTPNRRPIIHLDQSMADRSAAASSPQWRRVRLGGGSIGGTARSVLGPLLFLNFINDLEERSAAKLVYKFADTKVDKIDRVELQRTLDELADWAERWRMSLNVQKCKLMHAGHANQQYEYSMNTTVLETTAEERDLGVVMSATLKPKSQCAKAARTTQTVLSQIARAFHFRDKNVFLNLYKQYVRPHLEFAVQAGPAEGRWHVIWTQG